MQRYILWKAVLFFVVAMPLAGIAVVAQAHEGTHSSGCIDGNGMSKTETRVIGPFEDIRISGAFDVSMTRGEKNGLTVTADANLLPYVTAKVQGKTLVVTTSRSICTTGPLLVEIVYQRLNGIDLAGANDLLLEGLAAERFSFRQDGSGTSRLRGQAGTLGMVVAGAADVDASALKADHVSVEVTGAGDVSVHATGSLDVVLAGVGDLTYTGNPKITSRVTGVGEIVKK